MKPTPKRKPEIAYHFRGLVERGSLYRWRDGYSQNSESGKPLYPWLTMRECCEQAREQFGGKAVFYRDGRRLRC